MNVLIESHYFPSIHYFASLAKANSLYIESKETFQKQSFRNRCEIYNGQKKISLVVPVNHRTRHFSIEQLEIDYSERWQNQHWRTIQAAYGKAPFFDYYAPEIKTLIYSNEKFLFNLNQKILQQFLIWFPNIQLKTEVTTSYQTSVSDNFIDLRSVIHPKKKNRSIEWIRYNQHFNTDFVPNLSIIDILMCEGPAASLIIDTQSSLIKCEPTR